MPELTNSQQHIVNTMGDHHQPSDWNDWRWQVRHAIRDLPTVEQALEIQFDQAQRDAFQQTVARFPLSVTPYYLSLIDADDLQNDPVFRQAFPSAEELHICSNDIKDPLAEDKDSPVPGLTHRYPDRVLLTISNVCAMYCRHCTRKRKVGDQDSIPDRDQILAGIQYIKDTPQVRDVLLSGGDPFLLNDDYLDWVLTELDAIEHVQVVRIGTRTPVVLPQRITPELVEMLQRHHPIWINTHFNHPREMTRTACDALAQLANAGIPLGNQSVLLAGVNDCPRIMKELVHKLVQNRVRPYYLYQCDLSEGLTHFRTPVGKGIEIMESLIGHTSGFSVPTYVIDAPGGGGKIPVMPQYLISWSTNKVILRNFEGTITTYKEPDSYEPYFCDRKCDDCHLQMNLNGASEWRATGIHKLMADFDETICLTPTDSDRMQRRDDDSKETDND